MEDGLKCQISPLVKYRPRSFSFNTLQDCHYLGLETGHTNHSVLFLSIASKVSMLVF